MKYIVTIKPANYTIIVENDETVLDAALRQDYDFPYDCYSGTCATCCGKILSGKVHYEHEIFGIEPEDVAAGKALFCSAKPLSDLVIEMDNVIGPEILPTKKLCCDVSQVNDLTSSVKQVLLTPSEGEKLIYRAGQYLEIILSDSEHRPFSIANSPVDASMLELHIRHQPENEATRRIIDEIENKKQLTVSMPHGRSIYHKQPQSPIILLAGGTGFAPIKAIIENALAEGMKQPMHLYWGVSTLVDLYMLSLPQRWAEHVPNFHFTPVLSQPKPETQWQGKTGMVYDAVLSDYNDLSDFQVYAAGPAEMVFLALNEFQKLGFNKAFMYSDAFGYDPKAFE